MDQIVIQGNSVQILLFRQYCWQVFVLDHSKQICDPSLVVRFSSAGSSPLLVGQFVGKCPSVEGQGPIEDALELMNQSLPIRQHLLAIFQQLRLDLDNTLDFLVYGEVQVDVVNATVAIQSVPPDDVQSVEQGRPVVVHFHDFGDLVLGVRG